MKKSNIYLLIIFFSLGLNSYSQQKASIGFLANLKTHGHKGSNKTMQSKPSAVYAPGRSVNYNWSYTSNNWQYVDTTLFSYTSQGLIIELVKRSGIPFSRTLSEYDSKERLVKVIEQDWNYTTNTWMNDGRTSTIYDQHDNQIEYRYEYFNSSTNQWVFSGGYKNVITYNANNWVLSNVEQSWNSSLSIWEDDSRILYSSFHGNGAPTQYEYQFKNGNTWENDVRYSDVYSIFNQLIEEMVELWNGSAYIKAERAINISWHDWTGSLLNSAPATYTIQEWGSPNANQWNTILRSNITYDSFGGSIRTDQDYTNSQWINGNRYSTFFDHQSNFTGTRSEGWLSTTNTWKLNSEEKLIHFIGFNGSTNVNKTIWQYWNTSTQVFQNNKMEEYSDFKLISGISSHSNLIHSGISIFPNPFSTSCTLRMENSVQNSENNLSIYLYDLFGKVVYQSTLSGQETQIEKGNLAQGIYFYSVMDKNSVLTKGKLVIE